MSYRFARNSALGTLASLFTTFGNFAGGLIIARLLGVEGAGTVGFAFWVVTMTVAVGALGIPPSLIRYLPELTGQGEDKQAADLSAVLFRIFLASCAIFFGGYCLYAFWLSLAPVAGPADDVLRSPLLWILVGVWCVTQLLAEFHLWYLQGMQRFGQVALLTVISATCQLSLLFVCAYFFGVFGAVIGYIAGTAVQGLGAFGVLSLKARLDPTLKRRIFQFSVYRWASTITSAFVFSRMEVFFLQVSWGNDLVGFFTVALALSGLASQGPLLLTRGLMPLFSEKVGLKDFDGIHSIYATGTRILAFLAFPACFGMAAITPELLPLIYGERFAPAIPAAVILMVASAGVAASSIGGTVVAARERTDFEFFSGLAGAVLSVLLGLTLIPWFGLIGAALTRAIVQLSVVAVGNWFIGHHLKCPVPYASLARLMVAAAACAIVARATGLIFPGFLGMLLSIAVGGLVYLIGVRLLNALPKDDIDRLSSLLAHLPGPIGKLASPALRLLSSRD
ncbi:MAG: polysaccharide biosynthesis protein [Hyphomicrobiales bacterium]|nr:polysaccharide biosynthesis protein [Hyphomicrobiales bacterium]